VQTAAECLEVAAKGKMGIFQPARKRITKTKDSLAERGRFEQSRPFISRMLPPSIATNVALPS
jgi:hypothetical protein